MKYINILGEGSYELAFQGLAIGLVVMSIVYLLLFILYFLYCYYVNKFHILRYGKGTLLSFFPLTNIYILGKDIFRDFWGFVYAAVFFLASFLYMFKYNELTNLLFYVVIIIMFPLLLLLSFIKYFKLKENKKAKSKVYTNNYNQLTENISPQNQSNTHNNM